MIEPKFIYKDNAITKGLDYDSLIKQGIELIQQFSGNQWTDFNYHDPGITFLEQICFALTDLSYKSNFPIEDILLAYSDKFDLENNNLLIPPEEIFPSSPSTPYDYRKIIIDQENTVKNAWVNPVKDDVLGTQGIFDVLIQLKDGLNPSEIKTSIKNIEDILMDNRSIGTDFNPIIILKKDIISLSGEIIINSFVLGESVLAKLYYEIENKLNKELKFYDFDDVLNSETFENVFSGPLQRNKYIKETELKRKTNEIYQSEIKEIIQGIEGVISIKNLTVYKNGIKMFNDIISFDNDYYPSLEKDYYNSSNKLNFSRNETSYEIDTTILTQVYDSIALNDKNTYSKPYKSNKVINPSRFLKKEIEYYYSIQNELPSIYGLKEFEISSSSSSERKSQVNQLKGYLLLIEQVMANYLSQLVNIRNLFSVNPEKNSINTFFNQVPFDIAELEKVIGEDSSSFLSFLNSISETDKKLIIRKNSIVDHLISRFGETYETSLLTKLDKSIYDHLSNHEIEIKSLLSKLNYSRAIVKLGRNRIKGFNFKKNYNIKDNISGLRHRLCLVLGIENTSIKSIIEPLLDNSEIDKIKQEWKPTKLEIDNGPTITVLSQKDSSEILEEANFFCSDYSILKSLFLYAHKRKNYQIVKTKSNYNIIFNSPKQRLPSKIFHSNSIKDCEESLFRILTRFRSYNKHCESFFLVENILLRPLVETKYELIIYLNDKKKLISYYNTEYNELRDLRDDLWHIVLKSENYSVEKDPKTGKNIIIIYDLFNNPILKSETQFNSIAVAKKEKTRILSFFKSKIDSGENINEISEISITNNRLNKFPNNFKYSNHISFIFPDWPVRFQNNEFKVLINNCIREYIPAHLSFEIFYLDFEQIGAFESVYFKWLELRRSSSFEKLEKESLQLIQLIMSYQNYDS